jgi:hypothetical protein
MALTPDEEKRLREQIRSELRERERRMTESKQKEETGRQKNLESRIRQQIVEEEEERYFTERGYVKYVNRYGGAEWLTPEEAEKRQSRRRNKKKSPGRRVKRQKRIILKWVINGSMALFALMVFMYLLRFNPIKQQTLGSLMIKSDVPGARVYLNGTKKRGFFTPDTLKDLSAGAHFISIYKEGYSAWPPMQRITVKAGKITVTEFKLKSSGVLGTVAIKANINDFQLYVDGIAVPPGENNIIEIPAGYRVLTAVKQGYIVNPPHHRILVKENDTTQLNFHFEKQDDIGYLQISSNSSTSYVFVDNVLTGIKANAGMFPVKEGIYEVRICENGYRSIPEVELITVIPGQTHAISFHMNQEMACDTMQVITPNPGAGIIVDGQWMPYVTPVTELVLSEGIHYLNLMRDDRFYSDKEIALTLNNLTRRNFIVDF